MTTRELLELERRTRQLNRECQSLQKQFVAVQSSGTVAPNFVAQVRKQLLLIKDEITNNESTIASQKQTISSQENQLTTANRRITALEKLKKDVTIKMKQVREEIIEGSYAQTDAVFREYVVKVLREIRGEVERLLKERQEIKEALLEIRKEVLNENNRLVSQSKEIENLETTIIEKNEIIDRVKEQTLKIREAIIDESSNVTPQLFKTQVANQLKVIREEVSKLINERESESKSDELSEDSNLIPVGVPSKMPSTKVLPNVESVKYYTSYICPFSQRVWLTLNHKKVNYEIEYVDLTNKSNSFNEAYSQALFGNPKRSAVPLIQYKNKYLCESEPLIRFLDSEFSGNSLTPNNEFSRIGMNCLISWSSCITDSYYGILSGSTVEERLSKAVTLKENCKLLNTRLTQSSKDGPFYGGSNATLFDFAVFPFFDRMPICEMWYKKGESLVFSDLFVGNDRLKLWYNAMMKLPAVQACHRAIKEKYNMEPLQYYKNGYASYVSKS